MPEMHLKQPEFTYSACESFSKNKAKIRKFKETGDANYIFEKELDKACCQHDIAYGDFKDFAKRTASDKFSRNKGFNVAKNSNYDGYQRGVSPIVYKFFDKKSAGGGVNLNANNERPLDLAEELHKSIIRKFKKEQFIQDLKTIFAVLI